MNVNNKNQPTVCNVSVKYLRKRNFNNFKQWKRSGDKLYIGRNMEMYVPGTIASKWANPFTVKKYGLETCLKMYKKHVLSSDLYDQIEELAGKELGCWCKPEKCHGDVLIELYNQKIDELMCRSDDSSDNSALSESSE